MGWIATGVLSGRISSQVRAQPDAPIRGPWGAVARGGQVIGLRLLGKSDRLGHLSEKRHAKPTAIPGVSALPEKRGGGGHAEKCGFPGENEVSCGQPPPQTVSKSDQTDRI